MSATGNTSHNATVQNGATVSDIGTTNIKVICNDNSGYAIYAIGYTDDTYGKTVLTSSTLGSTHNIITSSTVTTGTSSWAMKLTSQTGTYAPTIVTDFASYHAVPAEYTKVAYLTSSTDTGNNATGSNLTTTYRTYISQTQPAGTYVGQVKYTLVHPNDRRAPGIPSNRQVQVTYNAGTNGYFDNDTTVKTNVVVYDVNCETDDKEYEVVKSQNLDDNGNKISSFTTGSFNEKEISIRGASKLKIVMDYDFAFNEGNTDGDNGSFYICDFDNGFCNQYFGTNTHTLIINNNSVTIYWYKMSDTAVTVDSNHDYGFYAKVYPLDENDEEYTYKEYFNCVSSRVSGTYKEPESTNQNDWFDGWGAGPGIDPWYDEDELMQDVLPNVFINEITANASWYQ